MCRQEPNARINQGGRLKDHFRLGGCYFSCTREDRLVFLARHGGCAGGDLARVAYAGPLPPDELRGDLEVAAGPAGTGTGPAVQVTYCLEPVRSGPLSGVGS